MVRVTPGAQADRIDGVGCDASGRRVLKLRVRAAPEAGAANAAVERLLAAALATAKGRVRVVRGHASRLKTLELDGVDEADIEALMRRHSSC